MVPEERLDRLELSRQSGWSKPPVLAIRAIVVEPEPDVHRHR